MNDYVAAAGGFTCVADRNGTNERQPNGEVQGAHKVLLFLRTKPDARADAEISVPARDPEDKTDLVAVFGAIAHILASVVAIVAVATR